MATAFLEPDFTNAKLWVFAAGEFLNTTIGSDHRSRHLASAELQGVAVHSDPGSLNAQNTAEAMRLYSNRSISDENGSRFSSSSI